MIDFKKMLSKQKIIPLLLHKIFLKNKSNWEDISTIQFDYLISRTKILNQIYKYQYLFTFDDGNFSDYSIAYKRLYENNTDGIFFVITNNIGKKGYLSWPNIKEMSANGMIFGSHSDTHQNMRILNSKKAAEEFKRSKNILEQNLGKKINMFSFPFGEYSKQLISIGKQEGYEYFWTSKKGIISNQSQIFPRNNIYYSYNEKKINEVLDPNFYTTVKWKIFDFSKFFLKSFIGKKNYKKLRDEFFL